MAEETEKSVVGTVEKPAIKQNGGYPMHTFEDVREFYYPYIHSEKDRAMIKAAYEYAKKKHAGIFRKSGEPYLQHLIEVAYICASLQSGPVTIAAAFLHDVVEDTDATVEDIKNLFGEDTAKIVDSLTKIQRLKLSHRTQEEFEAEDHRKIFLGMAKDVRVIIIKLADRLHNMRTVEALSDERQHALGKETLEVFAPIAHRLGIYRLESELEDLSLKILEPKKYADILEKLNKSIKDRSKALDNLKKKIADFLIPTKIKFEIESRIKSIYSIYKKMYVKDHSFEEIYDVLALRIITESELNCYEILGIIHAHFKPLPGRFKDYIAMPKPNMYQSLHTTIIAGDGNIFEVQIRTRQMDEVAETGVAAHWRYKENSNYNPKQEQREIEEQLHWFRDFVSMSSKNQNQSAQEYMEALSKDIFEANVYVFTPKGKVIDLPAGSTPIDLAYRIHTKIGDTIVGAMVNNTLVPINTPLKTGDIVEIKTSATATGPNESWLNMVKTSSAKQHIKKFLQKKNDDLLKDDKIQKGKQSCFELFRDRGYSEKEMLNLLSTDNVLNNYQCKTLDDLLIKVYQHNPNPGQICDFLGIKAKQDEITLSKKKNYDDDKCPVTVDGESGFKITLGNCCTPIPGDEIIGYVTKGNGITVHRVDCPNIQNENKRLIDVHRRKDLGDDTYPVDIVCECMDRNNLLIDIMNTLSSLRIKCTEVSAKLFPDNIKCGIYCQICVVNLAELDKTFAVLKTVKSVIDVKRLFH
jgi:guanosine-3',5'-bis(diphosphate) 3'-pyrophosphohydrolase